MNTLPPTPPTGPTPTPTETKRPILNALAILGFLAVIILIAWLSIQVVKVLPTAFSSLANLAETLRGDNDRTIVITGPEGDITPGSEVNLSWEAAPVPGTYTFSYTCVEGISIEIRKDDTTREVRCDTTYSLDNETSVRLFVTSDLPNNVSVPYTVTFLRTNDTTARLTGTGQITVRTETETETVTATPEPVIPDEEIVVVAPAEPTNPAPVVTPAPKPATRTEYITYIPTSDPRGTTDLAVGFIEMGIVQGSSLVTRTTFTDNTENFFRFEVRNIGTKTSGEWSYTTSLPNSGAIEHDDQKPLKPNERAVITVRFPVDTSGTARVRVAVTNDTDRTSNNNTLTWNAVVR